MPNNLRFIGRGRILNIVPVAFLIWIALLSYLFLFCIEQPGRLYAVAANSRTAQLSGVKNDNLCQSMLYLVFFRSRSFSSYR